jgi:omega-amidase
MASQIKNRVALLQFHVSYDKSQNIVTARQYITKAREAGARLCVLPECWNSPYATAAFGEYSENLPKVGDGEGYWGPSTQMLVEMAKSSNMYIVGGSVPEMCGGKLYNTCLVVNPDGMIVGKHRKVHLFDIDVPGGITFIESETLSAGDGATYFDMDENDESGLGRIGVGICYDIRFPEYALLLTQTHQCRVLIYPGAFNLTTGPAHWELLQRARAVDGQCFVLTASPARLPPPEKEQKYPHYSAWGHSTAVSPWGEVIATCDENPNVVVVDLDMNKVTEMRTAIPTCAQKRHDLYKLVSGDGI